MATLNGNIQPPPPSFDPYGPAGSSATAPPCQDQYLLPPGQFALPPMMAQAHRFLQDVRLDYHWFAGHGSNTNELGINDADMSATFAIPFFMTQQAPLLITPGFAFHLWDGPQSTGGDPADMPPLTYDAYLDVAWNPQLTPFLGGELSVRTGVYSDFQEFTTESLRVTGKGMAVLTFSPTIKVKAGVWYLDRVHVKLLPAGGIVWTPTPDVRFDILFPNPKFTQKFAVCGDTEWWWYFSGEYGGGTWTIKRAGENGFVPDSIDTVSYDDIRLALGLEFTRCGGFKGWLEGGYAFDRELVYRSQHPYDYRPNDAFYVRAGFSF